MRFTPKKQKLISVRNQDGYTLTEMLVVIGIIAMIAAVLTPNLLGQLGRSRAKAAQLQLETTASAVEIFRTDVGRYPTQEEGLAALIKDPNALTGWAGPYLRDSKSLNDPWNDPLKYTLAEDGRSFFVETLGADGKTGGTGQNKDLRAPVEP
jgi:general secretion pathway protein G